MLELQSGKDASEKVFDRRSFSPFTNPVFIEVHGGPKDVGTGTSALGMNMGVKSSAIYPTTFVRGSPVVKEKQRPFHSKMAGEGIPGLAEIQVMVAAKGK